MNKLLKVENLTCDKVHFAFGTFSGIEKVTCVSARIRTFIVDGVQLKVTLQLMNRIVNRLSVAFITY